MSDYQHLQPDVHHTERPDPEMVILNERKAELEKLLDQQKKWIRILQEYNAVKDTVQTLLAGLG